MAQEAKVTWFHRPLLKIYKPKEIELLPKLKAMPTPNVKDVGRHCKITDRDHEMSGQTGTVTAVYGEFAEVMIVRTTYILKRDQLEWHQHRT